MDAVTLARIQFGITAGFHFLFPPLSIGMGWLLVWFAGRWKRTGSDEDERVFWFWLKLFALTFAVGVATGITLEFEFGMNWAEYSRYVGDIFGAPLAAEGILAFFLESTFLGVLLFGRERLSRRAIWFATVMVAVGATLSAFWIIVANSWQQTPAGYKVVGGRAELSDFWQAMFNPSTLPRYFHTVCAALIAGGFFVFGVSAYLLRKGRAISLARSSIVPAVVLAAVASFAELPLGHWHAVQVAHTQPAKFAAMEGLFRTQTEAPLLVFGIPDVQGRQVLAEVSIPGWLSLFAFGDTAAEVKGLDAFEEDEWPPVVPTFAGFHLMFILGMLFIGFSALALLLLRGGRLFESSVGRLVLRLAPWMIPLPLVASELGWITAEMGRQPWIVQGLLRTSQASSKAVPAWQVGISLSAYLFVYALVGAIWLYLIAKTISSVSGRSGPASEG